MEKNTIAFRDKEFLRSKGCSKLRDDTYFILGSLYDKVEKEGLTDEVLGNIAYIREYIWAFRDKYIDKYGSYQSPISIKSVVRNFYKIFGEELKTDYITYDDFKKNKLEHGNITKIKCAVLDRNPNLSLKKVLEVEEFDKIDKTKKFVSEKNIYEKTGIYGIYFNDTLIYIGETTCSFGHRFNEHKKGMAEGEGLYLYKWIKAYRKEGDKIELKPIVILEDIESDKRKFTNNEIKCMELALIKAYNPICNLAGRTTSYIFGQRKR